MQLDAGVIVTVAPPEHPAVGVTPPVPSAVTVLPSPGRQGLPGKDGADLTPDQISTIVARVTAGLPPTTYLHVQNSPAQDWPITHPLTQPVAAVHVVTSGEDVLVPWVELPDRTVIVSFGAPASGTATLT